MSEYSEEVLKQSDEMAAQTKRLMGVLSEAHRQWVKSLPAPTYITAVSTHIAFRAMSRLLSIETACADLPEFMTLINSYADEIKMNIEYLVPKSAKAKA